MGSACCGRGCGRGCGNRQPGSQSSRLGWQDSGWQGRLAPCPGLLALLGGRQRMNGLGHRVRTVLGALAPAALGCVEPVWQGPQAFEGFCGGWLLLPHSLFQPFHSQPRQETLGSPVPPGRLGKQRSSFGDTRGQSRRTGVSGGQICREADFIHPSL